MDQAMHQAERGLFKRCLFLGDGKREIENKHNKQDV